MIYRFGSFELDERAGELRKNDEPVPLQPKPLELLALLLRERDRIVPLDELFETLWPGTVVTPGSLTRAVSLARRAIDDTHKGSKASLIRSFPKRGYRFMGEVWPVGATAAPPAPPAPPARADRPAPRPAPAVAGGQADAFVGREDALGMLHDCWQRAASGRGQLVLVSGRPGIGKTRLSEVFCEQVARPGRAPLVARGRDGEGVPAFWLWAQVLRRLAAEDPDDPELCAVVASLPELRSLVPGVAGDAASPGASGSPEQVRFLFFDGVHRLLARRAARAPVLLVLDDLQSAGAPSLRLLEHLAYEMSANAILVVATVRDSALEGRGAVSDLLRSLRRCPVARHVSLPGFSRGEVGRLLEQLIGRRPPPDLTSELYARTEGSPLFVREAVRVLAERGDLAHPERIARNGISLPQESLDLIRRAVEALPPPAAELMRTASVLGRAFGLRFLALVAELEPEQALDLLDEAAAAGVVETVPDRAATFRFQHALHREAAYGSLSVGERTRLHWRAAQILEGGAEARIDRVLGELAHHHYHALAVGDPALAHRRAVQAGERAGRLLAYEEAATYFEHALVALEHAEQTDAEQRLEALLRLGEAHRLSGDRERRRTVMREALELARSLGRARDVARAAIGICDLSEWGVRDEAAESALDTALAELANAGEGDGVDHVRLTTRVAYLRAIDATPEAEAIARDAVARARASGDAEALQEALYTLHFRLAGPDHVAERSELAGEMVDVVARSPSNDPTLIALLDIACDRLMCGDAEGARAYVGEARRVAGERPHSGLQWHLRAHEAGMAIMQGRFEEGERLAGEAWALGSRIGHPYARGIDVALRAVLCRERGDYDGVARQLEPALRATQGAYHWIRGVLARSHLRQGRLEEARQLYDVLARDDFTAIPRNIRWTNTVLEVGFLCAELERDDHAARVAELLADIEHQHGVLPIPVCYGGPLCHALGLLHDLRGDADGARALISDAVEACRAMGAGPARARAERDLARLLARSGERRRARALLESARETAQALGMAGLLAELDADAAAAVAG